MQTVGRFAPSPSGRMHLWKRAVRAAAWLSARHQNGAFLLRIEDLDAMRCPRSYADLIMDDLRWLGLDWDGEVPYQSSGRRCMKNTSRSCVKGAALSVLLLPGRAPRRECAASFGRPRAVCRNLPGLTPAEIEKAEKTCTCNACACPTRSSRLPTACSARTARTWRRNAVIFHYPALGRRVRLPARRDGR